MTNSDLLNLMTRVTDAHNAALAVLQAVGPGVAYDAAADAADALEATLEAAADEAALSNRAPISVPVW